MSSITASFPPPPPPGLNYIDAIRPSLNFILALTPLGAVLVPLIITLFVFSSPQSRRHPVFILNVLACCSGIVEAATNAALETKQILYPLEPVSKSLLTTVIAFSIVSPLFIDSILLFRILAFYPIGITPTSTLVAIFSFPILVKCGRFVVVVMYLNSFAKGSGNLPNVLLAATSTWPRNPYIMAEWSMQMADNTYASAFFLYKIWEFRRTREDVPVIRSKSLLSYLRSLFLIALGNFVFPIIMNIASIVLIARDPSFINGSYILLTNNYVAIIGVVFATIWTRKQNWNNEERSSNRDHRRRKMVVHNESRHAYGPTINATSVLSTLRFGADGSEQETEASGFSPSSDTESGRGGKMGMHLTRDAEEKGMATGNAPSETLTGFEKEHKQTV
ncbi:hypothetical protein P691DRAFT_775406 [Macrolepiota fuliginosa MF-IS2]|uniref:Uncharacterized protein n=1 Tax=Macrolepiota fuliginosa MF-IS2 TaxID=1400762 RepID=A0A9P5XFB1_9AGAR|nr:hypothetical protein P691DRAFT_775406 [Macrolepiota fuliginosa MF-IS2]